MKQKESLLEEGGPQPAGEFRRQLGQFSECQDSPGLEELEQEGLSPLALEPVQVAVGFLPCQNVEKKNLSIKKNC